MDHGIKLKEVIWEITPECNNGCTYCGSKETTRIRTPGPETIKSICNAIASYLHGGEVNISGGDPLLVDYSTITYVISTLKKSNNLVKLIVNPKSFTKKRGFPSQIELFDWVGLSVNTNEELMLVEKYWDEIKAHCKGVTVITNFNTSNIWMYSKLENFVNTKRLIWQIQYTMYKNASEEAIYENEDAKKFLFDKIENTQYNTNIILADNIIGGSCSAGMGSIGILYSGDIVPCLSFRSWNINMTSYGNLLHCDLKTIWEMKLSTFRCNPFVCCKDHVKAPYDRQTILKDESLTESELYIQDIPQKIVDFNRFPNIVMYGVGINTAMVYGV